MRFVDSFVGNVVFVIHLVVVMVKDNVDGDDDDGGDDNGDQRESKKNVYIYS